MKKELDGNISGRMCIVIMESNSLSNNELITGISILAVLRYSKIMEISKCMLIEPLMSYHKVTQLLERKNSSIKSIEDLIIKESITFSTFNDRYMERFVLTINAIMLFSKMGLLEIKDNLVVFQGEDFDFNNQILGQKAKRRITASYNLSKILDKGETSDLYLSLRIHI